MCFLRDGGTLLGSAVLGAAGVAALREVKDRRELLLAAMPCLFAAHEFIEGFVWMGLDGSLPQWVAHDAGSAYVLYAQGLLAFLLPFSVFLIEPTKRQRRRMLGFVILGGVLSLYLRWGLIAYPYEHRDAGAQHCLRQRDCDDDAGGCAVRNRDLRGAVLLRLSRAGGAGLGELHRAAGGVCGEALCVHLGVVRVCGGGERDHLLLLPAHAVRAGWRAMRWPG